MEEKCCEEVRNAKFIDKLPLVSVAIIAYNLEKYIVDCLESVLSQKTNFKVEIVIGEDCSKDNTLQILLNYQERFPNIIRVLIREKNLGLTPNSVDTQNNCKGKYIALLDGDDYWTDGNKLQKQIDFLASKGIITVLWSLTTIDWDKTQNDGIDLENKFKDYLHPGAIVLMHDQDFGKSEQMLVALEKMILYGKSQGYRFVTIEKMK